MKVDIPALQVVEGDNVIFKCEGYDELYKWAQENDKATLAFIMGCAEFVLLCGEVPLKIDRKTDKLYALNYYEVPIDEGKKEEKKNDTH